MFNASGDTLFDIRKAFEQLQAAIDYKIDGLEFILDIRGIQYLFYIEINTFRWNA